MIKYHKNMDLRMKNPRIKDPGIKHPRSKVPRIRNPRTKNPWVKYARIRQGSLLIVISVGSNYSF